MFLREKADTLEVDPDDPAGRYKGAVKGNGRSDFNVRFGLSKPPITGRDPSHVRVTHSVSINFIYFQFIGV